MARDDTRDRRVPRRPVLRRGLNGSRALVVRTDGGSRRLSPALPVRTGIQAFLVFFEYDDVSDDVTYSTEPLIAVLREGDDISDVLGLSHYNGHTGSTDTTMLPLQGPDAPYSVWPDIDVVHVVSSGGISNAGDDTGLDPVARGIFVDLAGAEIFAQRHNDPTVVVRTVPVGVLLQPSV